jgi:hypothetical protein
MPMLDEMSVQIIVKLARREYWGHRLMNLSDLIKSVPKHHRKRAKHAIITLYARLSHQETRNQI